MIITTHHHSLTLGISVIIPIQTLSIAQLLAKAVWAMAGVVLLDVVRSVLKLATSSMEADLQESLAGLTVRHLKDLCSELWLKTIGTKAVLIGELVTFWKRQNVGESSAGRQISFASTVDIKTITGWTKYLSLLRDFTFMNVCVYLI